MRFLIGLAYCDLSIYQLNELTTVEVDEKEEQIISTSGHKYYFPNNTESREIGMKQEHESYITLSEKWVSACKLKADDNVLFSDGKYGIIISVSVEEIAPPEATYNLEVADFHKENIRGTKMIGCNEKQFLETMIE